MGRVDVSSDDLRGGVNNGDDGAGEWEGATGARGRGRGGCRAMRSRESRMI
jgi:hypothetical protein